MEPCTNSMHTWYMDESVENHLPSWLDGRLLRFSSHKNICTKSGGFSTGKITCKGKQLLTWQPHWPKLRIIYWLKTDDYRVVAFTWLSFQKEGSNSTNSQILLQMAWNSNWEHGAWCSHTFDVPQFFRNKTWFLPQCRSQSTAFVICHCDIRGPGVPGSFNSSTSCNCSCSSFRANISVLWLIRKDTPMLGKIIYLCIWYYMIKILNMYMNTYVYG
jgi:hypothetical protein